MRDDYIHIRVPKEVKDQLKVVAEDKHKTMSAWIEEKIRAAFKRIK